MTRELARREGGADRTLEVLERTLEVLERTLEVLERTLEVPERALHVSEKSERRVWGVKERGKRGGRIMEWGLMSVEK